MTFKRISVRVYEPQILWITTMVILTVFLERSIGISLQDALLPTLLLVANVLAGGFIWSRISRLTEKSLIELLGGGIAIGTIIPAAMTLLLRQLGLSVVPSVVAFPLVTLGLAYFINRRSKGKTVSPSVNDFKIGASIMCLTAISTLGWTPKVLPFCIVFGICLSLYGYFTRNNYALERNKDFRQISIALITITSFSIFVQAIYAELLYKSNALWVWVGMDQILDESVSWSTQLFAFRDNPTLSGTRMFGYHLTNVIAGELSAVSNSSPFIVTSGIMVLIAIIGSLSIVYSLSYRLFKSKTTALIAMFLLVVQATLPEPWTLTEAMRIQNVLGLTWFLFLVTCMYDWIRSQLKYGLVVIFLVSVAVTLGKAQFIVLLIAVVLVLNGLQLLTRTQVPSIGKLRLLPIMMIPVFMVSYKYIFKIPRGTTSIVNSTLLWTFVGPALILICTRFLVLRRPAEFLDQDTRHLHLFANFTTVVAISMYVFFQGSNGTHYLISAALAISSVAASGIVKHSIDQFNKKKSSAVLGLAFLGGALVSFGYYVSNIHFVRIANGGVLNAIAKWIIAENQYLLPLLSVVIVSFVCSILFIRSLDRHPRSVVRIIKHLTSILILVAVGTNSGFFLGQSFRHVIPQEIYDAGNLVPAVLSSDRKVALSWLRENSDKYDIVATNAMCNELTTPDGPTPRFQSSDCYVRNTNGWVSALSQRRVLIESPIFSINSSTMSQMGSERYNASLNFANLESAGAYRFLREHGVNWFVIDKDNTMLRDWLPFAQIRFENNTVAILELM
jgi:hypothetical protein